MSGVVRSTEQIEPSERLSDIIIPPSDYQHPSNYLHPNPTPQKQGSPPQHPQEHDSGVVADRDSDPFSRQASQVSGYHSTDSRSPPHGLEMPATRRPDSLAVRGHDYEELPTSRHQSMDFPSGDQLPPQQGPPMFTKMTSVHSAHSNHSNHTGSNDHLLFNPPPPLPGYRKRQNPLYESNDHEDSAEPVSKKPATGRSHCCLCPCLLMLTLLTLASLCFSLYVFTKVTFQDDLPRTAKVISPHNHSSQEMMVFIQKLQEHNTDLEEQVKRLESIIIDMESNNSVQRFKYGEMKEQFESHQFTVDSRFTQLSAHVLNVSKLPGPQGPSGSGNLSQCVHSQKLAGNSIFETYTETQPVPADLQQHNDLVILGVECTTDGGQFALMRIVRDQGFEQFKCLCSGKESDSVTSRQCEMHYWTCPKIS